MEHLRFQLIAKLTIILLAVIPFSYAQNMAHDENCVQHAGTPENTLSCISYQLDSLNNFGLDYTMSVQKLRKCASHFRKKNESEQLIKTLGYLAFIHEINGVNDSASKYYSLAEHRIANLSDPSLNLWFRLKMVSFYRRNGNYSTAILKLEEVENAGKNELSDKEKAKLYNTLGYFYQTIGKPQISVEYFFKAIEKAKDTNNKRLLAIIHNNLGSSYALSGDFATAENYFRKGVDVFESEEKVEIPILFNNIAEMNQEQGFLDKALKYYYKSLSYTSSTANDNLTEVAINISKIWLEKNQIDSAQYYLNMALSNAQVFGENSLEYIHALHASALISRATNNHLEAKTALTEAFNRSKVLNLKTELSKYALDLSNLYSELNNVDSSYYYLNLHVSYKDSLFIQSSKEQLIRKTEETKLDSIRVQSLVLEAEKEYLVLQVSKRNSVVILVSCVLGSLLLAAFFFWRSVRRKRQLLGIELENKRLTIESKNKELLGANLEIESRTRALEQLNERIKESLSKEYDPEFNELSRVLKEGSRLMNEQERKKYINDLIKLDNSFYQRLKSQYHGLTEDELKLAALIRLNLSTDELTDIFNISRSSLNTKRYRLRKKLDLDTSLNLDEFIHQF